MDSDWHSWHCISCSSKASGTARKDKLFSPKRLCVQNTSGFPEHRSGRVRSRRLLQIWKRIVQRHSHSCLPQSTQTHLALFKSRFTPLLRILAAMILCLLPPARIGLIKLRCIRCRSVRRNQGPNTMKRVLQMLLSPSIIIL